MINNLPLELQNKIWNYYWQYQFYNYVIIYFKQKEYLLLKAFDFIKKHILPQTEILNKKKYLEYYFHKINNFFISLHQENGLHLFLQKKYKIIAKKKSYIEYFKNFNPSFYYLCYYSINLSGQYRFYVLEAFRTLTFT